MIKNPLQKSQSLLSWMKLDKKDNILPTFKAESKIDTTPTDLSQIEIVFHEEKKKKLIHYSNSTPNLMNKK